MDAAAEPPSPMGPLPPIPSLCFEKFAQLRWRLLEGGRLFVRRTGIPGRTISVSINLKIKQGDL